VSDIFKYHEQPGLIAKFLFILILLALTFNLVQVKEARADIPYGDNPWPGYPGYDLVLGGIWSHSALAANMWRYGRYNFNANFAWYSAEDTIQVQWGDTRVWSSLGMDKLYSRNDGTYWWTPLWHSWNTLFNPGATIRVWTWGGSFVSKVCGNSSPWGVNPPPPLISGYKWNDLNGNGAWDPGEPALAGWEIDLYRYGAFVGRTWTDGNGYYQFVLDANNPNLLPNNWYYVYEVQKPGWYQTNGGGKGVWVGEGSGSAGFNFANNDFGNFQYGSIGGTKRVEPDADGVKGPEDTPRAGWPMILKKGGQQVAATQTGSDGSFIFSNLGPGTYSVEEGQQAGWYRTAPVSGSYSYSITSGASFGGADFLNAQYGSIQPLKVDDLNMNGIWDSGESLLAGWTMHLGNSQGSELQPPLVTTADQNASPSWSQLTAGAYTVWEDEQSGYVPTGDTKQAVTLAPGQTERVPFFNVATGGIEGYKYHDDDGDGVRQDTEEGIPGWTITLTGSDLAGHQVSETTLTDSNGFYQFTGLAPGSYRVSEEERPFWEQTSAASEDVTLASGKTVEVSFGNLLTGSITGQKFNDINGNGQLDSGEQPLPGVEISLSTKDGTTVGTPVLTDANGSYRFDMLKPGDYTVTETVPDGWLATAPTMYDLTVTGGQVTIAPNLLNVKAVTISGTKFDDGNANGVRDQGEPGIAGWQITLEQFSNGAWSQVSAQPTSADGSYSFGGLLPGEYRVSEEARDHWRQTLAPAEVQTLGGAVCDNMDFGNVKLGSITAVKWDDSNSNGVWDASESPIPDWGFHVTGTAINGEQVDTWIKTDANGDALLDNLLPGTYSAAEQTVGLQLNADGTVAEPGWRPVTPASEPVQLTEGANPTTSFGNIHLGWIWGRVTHEIWGYSIAGIPVVLEETGQRTVTNQDGYYFFYSEEPNGTAQVTTPDYTVELDLSGTDWMSHYGVDKAVVVPEGGPARADFLIYDNPSGSQPRTIGYWKNWSNHYAAAQMQSFVDLVRGGSSVFANLTVDQVATILTMGKQTPMIDKAKAQLLAVWLNLACGNLGADSQADLTSINGWQQVFDSSPVSVWQIVEKVESVFAANNSSYPNWEVIKDVLDGLNNGVILQK